MTLSKNKSGGCLCGRTRGKTYSCADPDGGQGSRPPEKSHVIWVSIGNKQFDPHPGRSQLHLELGKILVIFDINP